jgi:hypothetical protein
MGPLHGYGIARRRRAATVVDAAMAGVSGNVLVGLTSQLSRGAHWPGAVGSS